MPTYAQPSQTLWSYAAGSSDISAKKPAFEEPNLSGFYSNIGAHSSTNFLCNAVDLVGAYNQSELICLLKQSIKKGPLFATPMKPLLNFARLSQSNSMFVLI